MRFATTSKSTGSIKGFNRTSASVQSVRVNTPRGKETIGYRFECYGCRFERKFLDQYFGNSYGAALAVLNAHRCAV